MKKFLSFLSVMLLVLVFSSPAKSIPIDRGWNMDLTSLGGANYENILNITFTGSSYLNQQLTGPGIPGGFTLQDGDIFTESTILQQLSLTSPEGFVTTIENVYFYGENLTGFVTNVNNAGQSPDPGAWSFEYVFTDADTLGIYYFEDPVNVNDPFAFAPGLGTNIALFDNVEGQGDAPLNFVGGGTGFSGSTELSGTFSYVLGDVFTTSWGAPFEDLIADPKWEVLGFMELTNWILEGDLNYTFGDGFFDSTIRHSGDFQVAAIPEPTTLLLFATGLLGMAFLGRRKRL